MKKQSSKLTIVLLALVSLSLSAVAKKQPTSVRGTIMGAKANMTTAKYSNNILEIFEGDSWGTNPSILIFLFDHAKSFAPGKTIKVTPKSTGSNPHLHCRYRKKGEETLPCEIFTSGYTLSITFAKKKVGKSLRGQFKLDVPGKKTKLGGMFTVEMN